MLKNDGTCIFQTQNSRKNYITMKYMFRMRVLLLVGINVDYTNFDDVGKQNSNGRIEDNKMLVGFIVFYMSVYGYHSG